jgi:hypothetical protein
MELQIHQITLRHQLGHCNLVVYVKSGTYKLIRIRGIRLIP